MLGLIRPTLQWFSALGFDIQGSASPADRVKAATDWFTRGFCKGCCIILGSVCLVAQSIYAKAYE